MDYGRPGLADRMAAAYVLGTLRGPARRRFEALLPAHPALRRAVAEWEARLAPLSASVAPVEPDPVVWQRIERALFPPPSPAALPWWQRLAPWRAWSALATAAAIGLFVVGSQTPPPQAPIVVVLDASPAAAAALQARFVASVTADGRALVLRPLAPLVIDGDRALELWAVPAEGVPRSLGLVQPGEATTVLRPQLLRGTTAFAVSLEPSGGSPTGAPSGPIVSLGRLDS